MSQETTAPQPASQTDTNRSTLAIVMMVKNEGHRLAECLDLVKGWCDEIVIIDDVSTDNTVEVAKRYTDKVFVMASEDDHYRQWNRGSDRSESDWILHIDADEWVTSKLKEAINEILIDDQGHAGYDIMRLNFFLGHPMYHGGWHHKHRILFKRELSRCVGTGIHVRLKIDGPVGFLNADINHYPFTSVEQLVARQNHYNRVESLVMLNEKGVLPMRKIVFQTAVRPMKLFWKTYVKKKAYKDGWHGMVLSWLFAFAHFVLWIHYWEHVQNARALKSES